MTRQCYVLARIILWLFSRLAGIRCKLASCCEGRSFSQARAKTPSLKRERKSINQNRTEIRTVCMFVGDHLHNSQQEFVCRASRCRPRPGYDSLPEEFVHRHVKTPLSSSTHLSPSSSAVMRTLPVCGTGCDLAASWGVLSPTLFYMTMWRPCGFGLEGS